MCWSMKAEEQPQVLTGPLLPGWVSRGSGTGVGLGLPGSQTCLGMGRGLQFCQCPQDMERQLLPRSRSGPP